MVQSTVILLQEDAVACQSAHNNNTAGALNYTLEGAELGVFHPVAHVERMRGTARVVSLDIFREQASVPQDDFICLHMSVRW